MSDLRILRRCRRRGCTTATRTLVCGPCWSRLSKQTRGDIVRASSFHTAHPEDTLALECLVVAMRVAQREWAPAGEVDQ